MKIQNLLTLTLIFLVIQASAQGVETRQLEQFDAVSVSESIDLILVKGASNKAKIKASGADPEDVKTEVRGDRLIISMRSGTWRNVDVSVTLTYVAIEALKVSSSAYAKTEDAIKAPSFSVKVSSSGRAELRIDTDQLDVEVSSSGDLSISGSSDSQEVHVSSSGRYDGFELVSNQGEIVASSSGRASVHVKENLNATASSSGSVRYKEDPDKLIINTSSSGSVRKS